MKVLLPNTEKTITERIRLIIGSLAAVAGLITVVVGGSFSNYSDMFIWGIGLGLIIFGLLLAGSMRLIEAILSMSR